MPGSQTPREAANAAVTALQVRAAASGITLRAPPPEPTTCCGRGCNGCVWEGYWGAVGFWLDDAADRVETLPSR